jgi:hypothetical protein
MPNVLTFVIPVRHPANARNWVLVKEHLADTLRSISRQDHDGWKGIIVANHGADLPPLPVGFEVKHVDFPPNPLYEQGRADKETFYEAVREDKGRRILAGMLHAGEMGHVMIVDDDDFVSRRLTSFVARNRERNGWYIRDGYVWGEGDNWLYLYSGFSEFCGSSHIIRSDCYDLPKDIETASGAYLRRMLGSHIFIRKHLEASGQKLEPLPFLGAVYRVGHAVAHSKSQGVFRHFFLKKSLLRRPSELCRRVSRLRFRTNGIREEFFG